MHLFSDNKHHLSTVFCLLGFLMFSADSFYHENCLQFVVVIIVYYLILNLIKK